MSVYLNDPDVTLYHGDALQVLRDMPDGSVDCVVTSPPYWGLRDYGTGEWDGGDPDCDHLGKPFRTKSKLNENWGAGFSDVKNTEDREPMGQTCGKCGATRVDQQLGLEPTPDLFVQNMVNVFREVRRVLADHGTCWVNLGDSYAANRTYQVPDNKHRDVGNHMGMRVPAASDGIKRTDGLTPTPASEYGLKPKDLVGIPWRVAFALQADGWYLRSDIVWAKPNPMPESVTDRPTKSHEYVFLLTKAPRYFFDQEAVREDYEGDPEYRYGRVGAYQNRAIFGVGDGTTPTSVRGPDGRLKTTVRGAGGSIQHRDGERWPNSGRNVRSVWTIATQPYPEAHFATFPEELARRCILAGCPTRVCRVCGKPSERIVERGESDYARLGKQNGADFGRNDSQPGNMGQTRTAHGTVPSLKAASVETVGWSDCGHNAYRPGVVLDPFIGSGTTAKVARDHQRHAIGIDLNETYLDLAARRLQQLSLLAEA